MAGHAVCRQCAALKQGAGRRQKQAALLQAWVRAHRGYEQIGEYVDAKTWVHIRCPQGHDWYPTPDSVLNQGTKCGQCYGHTKELAEAKLRAIVAARNASIGSEYINSQAKILVICGKEHEWWVLPNAVLQGHWCFECVGNSPNRAAGAEFLAVLAEHDGRLDPDHPAGKYVSIKTPVAVICNKDHRTLILPGSRRRYGARGFCLECSPRDPDAARERTYAVLEKRGDRRLTDYAGAFVRMEILCPNNDKYSMTPHDIQSDRGCPTCKGKDKKVFYVLTTPEDDLVKFGVACRDGKQRLAAHKRKKLTVRERWLPDLPEGVALALERRIKAGLKALGIDPVPGTTESFPPEVRRTILFLVDKAADEFTRGAETA